MGVPPKHNPGSVLGDSGKGGQETGSSRKPSVWIGILMRHLEQTADYVSCRDEASCRQWQRLQIENAETPTVSTDLTFWTDAPQVSCDRGKRLEQCRWRIGVNVRRSVAGVDAWIPSLLDWEQKNPSVEIVPVAFQAPEDVEPWQDDDAVARLIHVRASSWCRDLAGLDLFFSMRLHGCILATQRGLPWFGMVYDPKVQGFADKIDWPFVAPLSELPVENVAEAVKSRQQG